VKDVAMFTSLLLFKNAVISNDLNDFMFQAISIHLHNTLNTSKKNRKKNTLIRQQSDSNV